MNRFALAVSFLACVGFLAVLFAQDNANFNVEGEIMKCSPPKFMIVKEIDMGAKTITGMLTMERSDPQPAVMAYHMSFKLSDVRIANARSKNLTEPEIAKLKGQLVVLYDGPEKLSGAYMGLFREDVPVITYVPEKQ